MILRPESRKFFTDENEEIRRAIISIVIVEIYCNKKMNSMHLSETNKNDRIEKYKLISLMRLWKLLIFPKKSFPKTQINC